MAHSAGGGGAGLVARTAPGQHRLRNEPRAQSEERRAKSDARVPSRASEGSTKGLEAGARGRGTACGWAAPGGGGGAWWRQQQCRVPVAELAVHLAVN